MNEFAKVTIEWENKRVTLEGPLDFVEEQAKKFRTLESKPLATLYPDALLKRSSIQSLIAEKQPKGHHEIVAVLAFYMLEEGKTEFSEQDIKRAYIQANIRPPKVIAQALRDAKNKFDYFESTKSRGFYKLSVHGDRTVRFDLPRDAS